MNSVARSGLDATPIPYEDGAPVRCMAIIREGLWRTAWGFDGCRRPEPFGPPYDSGKDAAAAAHRLNDRGGA